jgi:hypothetical protein
MAAPDRPAAPAGTSSNEEFMDLLAEVGRRAKARYPRFRHFRLVADPVEDGVALSIPCPQSPEPVEPEEESNAALILDALGEADRPPTIRELSVAAAGVKKPTGAFRRALARLVADGQVREIIAPGHPKTYDLP